MKSYESPDFFPSALKAKGLEKDDVVEFSELYRIPYEQSLRLVSDFNVDGNKINRLQAKFIRTGIELNRREAAHLYYQNESGFLNRTEEITLTPNQPLPVNR